MGNEKILIVDDDKNVREGLSRVLGSQGFQTQTADEASKALELLPAFQPDLVLTDIRMPGMDGVELARCVKHSSPDTLVIVITGYASVDTAIESLRLGVDDYIKKSPNMPELIAAVQAALKKRAERLKSRDYVEDLERKLLAEERKEEASFVSAMKRLFVPDGGERGALIDTVASLACSLSAKALSGKGHARAVGTYVGRMAEFLSFPPDQTQQLCLAGLFHDIGKIALPEDVLRKHESDMTAEERALFREHPTISAWILQPVRELEPIVDVVLHHHERYDGKGYPHQLSGESIPLGARMIAVADGFSLMREAGEHEQVGVLHLVGNRGTLFDPKMVDAFITIMHSVEV